MAFDLRDFAVTTILSVNAAVSLWNGSAEIAKEIPDNADAQAVIEAVDKKMDAFHDTVDDICKTLKHAEEYSKEKESGKSDIPAGDDIGGYKTLEETLRDLGYEIAPDMNAADKTDVGDEVRDTSSEESGLNAEGDSQKGSELDIQQDEVSGQISEVLSKPEYTIDPEPVSEEELQYLTENDFGAVNSRVFDYDNPEYIRDGKLIPNWGNASPGGDDFPNPGRNWIPTELEAAQNRELERMDLEDEIGVAGNEAETNSLTSEEHGQINKGLEGGIVLPEGTLIIQYAHPGQTGRFFAPVGTKYEDLQLPEIIDKRELTIYEVQKGGLTVYESEIAVQTWNKTDTSPEGTGSTQYYSPEPADKLVEEGHIQPIQVIDPSEVRSYNDNIDNATQANIEKTEVNEHTERTVLSEKDEKSNERPTTSEQIPEGEGHDNNRGQVDQKPDEENPIDDAKETPDSSSPIPDAQEQINSKLENGDKENPESPNPGRPELSNEEQAEFNKTLDNLEEDDYEYPNSDRPELNNEEQTEFNKTLDKMESDDGGEKVENPNSSPADGQEQINGKPENEDKENPESSNPSRPELSNEEQAEFNKTLDRKESDDDGEQAAETNSLSPEEQEQINSELEKMDLDDDSQQIAEANSLSPEEQEQINSELENMDLGDDDISNPDRPELSNEEQEDFNKTLDQMDLGDDSEQLAGSNSLSPEEQEQINSELERMDLGDNDIPNPDRPELSNEEQEDFNKTLDQMDLGDNNTETIDQPQIPESPPDGSDGGDGGNIR